MYSKQNYSYFTLVWQDVFTDALIPRFSIQCYSSDRKTDFFDLEHRNDSKSLYTFSILLQKVITSAKFYQLGINVEHFWRK